MADQPVSKFDVQMASKGVTPISGVELLDEIMGMLRSQGVEDDLAREMLSELMEGLSPDDITNAATMQEWAKQLGLPEGRLVGLVGGATPRTPRTPVGDATLEGAARAAKKGSKVVGDVGEVIEGGGSLTANVVEDKLRGVLTRLSEHRGPEVLDTDTLAALRRMIGSPREFVLRHDIMPQLVRMVGSADAPEVAKLWDDIVFQSESAGKIKTKPVDRLLLLLNKTIEKGTVEKAKVQDLEFKHILARIDRLEKAPDRIKRLKEVLVDLKAQGGLDPAIDIADLPDNEDDLRRMAIKGKDLVNSVKGDPKWAMGKEMRIKMGREAPPEPPKVEQPVQPPVDEAAAAAKAAADADAKLPWMERTLKKVGGVGGAAKWGATNILAPAMLYGLLARINQQFAEKEAAEKLDRVNPKKSVEQVLMMLRDAEVLQQDQQAAMMAQQMQPPPQDPTLASYETRI